VAPYGTVRDYWAQLARANGWKSGEYSTITLLADSGLAVEGLRKRVESLGFQAQTFGDQFRTFEDVLGKMRVALLGLALVALLLWSALAALAEASGVPLEKCEVHRVDLGGGFGRRGRSDYVTQAVLIAKQIPGTPVKMIWSREEDMVQGRYHPVMQCKLVGAFDAANNLTGLHMRLSGQSILTDVRPEALQNGKDPLVFQGLNPSGDFGIGYSVPNLLIDHAMRNTHVPPGFWRGVNINQNAIFLECFMDEMAHAAGQDPLDPRRPRLRVRGQAPLLDRRLQRSSGRRGGGHPIVFAGDSMHLLRNRAGVCGTGEAAA